MNIFLIGTEHQLFQVIEVIKYLKCNQNECILIYENIGNEIQFIDNLNKKFSFKKIITFQSWVFKDLFFDRNKINKFFKICSELINQEDIIFYYSHYDSDSTLLFSKIVKPLNSFLIDEGTASFTVAHYRRNFKSFNTKFFIKSLFYWEKIQLPKKLNYFTKFNLEINGEDKSFIYLIQKIENKSCVKENDVLYFLGSSISDIGFMNEEIYINLVKIIKYKYKFEMHYFSHRKESISKLKKIESLGIIIHENEIPFESYFLQLEKWPEFIGSFHFSNILDTIASSYSNVPNCILFKFDKHYILKDREVYEDIYFHNAKNSNLKIIGIDLNN